MKEYITSSFVFQIVTMLHQIKAKKHDSMYFLQDRLRSYLMNKCPCDAHQNWIITGCIVSDIWTWNLVAAGRELQNDAVVQK